VLEIDPEDRTAKIFFRKNGRHIDVEYPKTGRVLKKCTVNNSGHPSLRIKGIENKFENTAVEK
jgi:hypothetical protein